MNASSVDRREWSDIDFHQMDWHDVHIHGMAAVSDRFELRFDIDYILEWLCPSSKGGPIRFRIAPATLVFKDAGAVKATLDAEQGLASIDEIIRVKRDRRSGASIDTWDWNIRCHEGEISFEASGFQMVLRASPVFIDLPYLNSEARGLPSFTG